MNAPADYERLISPRFGPIRGIIEFTMPPRLPAGLISFGADVAHSLDSRGWHADRAAVGASFDDPTAARRAAIGEAVERYCGNFVPAGLRRASHDELRRAGVAAIVGALLRDTELEIIGAGFACRGDATQAALKALAEAVGTWFFSTGILDPDGAIWAAIRAGALDARAYKPPRTDRRYMDAYRADYRDVIELGSQMQIYLDPRMHTHASRMIDPPEIVPLAALPHDTGEDRRTRCLRQLRARGFRAFSVDVTTDDVRATGLRAVRVVVPGLYANAPAALPYLGGTRVYEEPAAMGWLPRPLTEEDLVYAPVPHV